MIGGPTGVGKTSYAIALARLHNAEIFSADSRQIYREMTIGTAKPSPEELGQVKHHFINHVSIQQPYTVGDYEREIITLLEEYFRNKDIAVLCGGTGLYIQAVIAGLDQFPAIPIKIRNEVRQDLEVQGLNKLLEELKQKDPLYYKEVDHANHRRILRAIEVIRSSGEPFSSFRKQKIADRPFEVEGKILVRDRAELYHRINTRVDLMMEAGLLEEVRTLLPYQHLPALQTVGYQELFDYLNGNIDLNEAIDKIKQNTRRYAKRQLTWFRNQTNFTEILID